MPGLKVDNHPIICTITLILAGFSEFATASAELHIEEVRVVGRQGRLPGVASDTGFELIGTGTGKTIAAPQNVAEILQNQPGVGYAGQGGLLQTISIRGLSRQRVANYFLDIPILTERRAGTSSSFIDPLMLSEIELLRGPASTHYGSGAMGGVLQLKPMRHTVTELELGWGSAGDENLQYFAEGRDAIDFALSHRGANRSESSEGVPLNTGFDQYNAKLGLRTETDQLKIRFNTLISAGRDIGKSNIRYPDERITDYPEEHHWLAQASIDAGNRWHGSAYFHYQDLLTAVDVVAGPYTEGESDALDLGGSGYVDWGTESWPTRLGLDYLARRNVQASERVWDSEGSLTAQGENLDAQQDQVGLYVDTSTTRGPLVFTGGFRQSWITQDSAGSSSKSDTFSSGFARASWSLDSQNAVHLELASALRFPSLSERYFSGVTGRGVVIGNPSLEPERSASVELGLSSSFDQTELEIRLYHTEIDAFITRTEVGPETLSFRNEEEGEISGAELYLQHLVSEQLSVTVNGQYIEGRDHNNDGLQDVAPNSIGTGILYGVDKWRGQLSYQYRFSKTDVSSAERAVDSAQLLSADLSLDVGRGVSVKFWGRNLLDDNYWISTDDLSTRGEERAVGFSIAWRGSDK